MSETADTLRLVRPTGCGRYVGWTKRSVSTMPVCRTGLSVFSRGRSTYKIGGHAALCPPYMTNPYNGKYSKYLFIFAA